MTRHCRHSADNLLQAAEEAHAGPHCRRAGAVPGRAFPHLGTFRGYLSCHLQTDRLRARAGVGARAASALEHSAIAICTAHVLNSVRAPSASFTKKLTRNERGPNRGAGRRRKRTQTRCNAPSCGARTPEATGLWSERLGAALRSGCRGPDREELCGPSSSRRAPLP